MDTSRFQRGFEDIPAREVPGLVTLEVFVFASLNLDLEVFGGAHAVRIPLMMFVMRCDEWELQDSVF